MMLKMGTLALAALGLSQVAVPTVAGEFGVRRISQQFQAWSLVCSETLAIKTKTCGVAQDILGPGGALAFHWELAESGDKAKVTIMLAPLLTNSVIVLRAGGSNVVIDSLRCAATGCSGTGSLPPQAVSALLSGGTVTAQFIYMNGTGSVIALSGEGFGDAWKAMRAEMAGHVTPVAQTPTRHAPTALERIAAETHFHD